jgi:L-fucono-1,5-lactonase
MTSRIDAHHHFWQIGRYPYAWIEPLSVLERDFGPDDLAPLLERHRIERSVLVQTIASLDETLWFLELARHNPLIAGVVGWVDLTDPAIEETLDELIAKHGRRLVGLRHNLHDEPDDRWILRDDVLRGLTAVAERRLAYDLLIRPRHLAVVLKLVERLPNLKFVIDHAGKPAIATRGWDDWASPLELVAKHPLVYCKLSGLITEADWQRWRPSDLKPYIDHVLSAFGPGRVMFGSDWPVCLLAGSYDRVIKAIEENTTSLGSAERAQVFGGTAEKFYDLNLRS